MSRRIVDVTAEELDTIAGEAWSTAAKDALTRGLSVTGSHNGRRFRYHPDGRVEDLGPVVNLATPASTPTFEVPKVEIPEAFGELVERRVAQAREGYEKVKALAENATDVFKDTFATASKSENDFTLKAIEVARANTNAAFDFASELLTVKSLSEAVKVTSAHTRKQLDAYIAQTRELTALAQKLAAEAKEPLEAGHDTKLRVKKRRRPSVA